MPAPAAIGAAVVKRRAASAALRWAPCAVLAVIGTPVFMVLLVLTLFAGSPEAECRASGGAGGLVVTPANPPAGLTPRQQQLFSIPLQMQPGRWYSTAATWFYAGDGSGTG